MNRDNTEEEPKNTEDNLHRCYNITHQFGCSTSSKDKVRAQQAHVYIVTGGQLPGGK